MRFCVGWGSRAVLWAEVRYIINSRNVTALPEEVRSGDGVAPTRKGGMQGRSECPDNTYMSMAGFRYHPTGLCARGVWECSSRVDVIARGRWKLFIRRMHARPRFVTPPCLAALHSTSQSFPLCTSLHYHSIDCYHGMQSSLEAA